MASAVLACAPKSCQPDAENLRTLVLDCLNSRPGQRPIEADARNRFEAIERRLGFDRLARSWEADDRTETSDELRRRGPQEPKNPDPTETVPSREDWSDIARRELEKGDLTAALAAAWKAVQTEGPPKIELYLMTVQRTAAILPPPDPRSSGRWRGSITSLARNWSAKPTCSASPTSGCGI